MSRSERRLAAIMFTDIVGYTALVQKDESLSLTLVEETKKLLRPIFVRHGGREVKTMGDAFLVEFASALEAVKCAYKIQQSLHDFNSNRPAGTKIFLRIGIHLGDVIHGENDVYGDAVNVASRIEPLAEPGGVCISVHVYDQVRNKFEFPMASLGNQKLKNVSLPIEVYKVILPWERERYEPAVFDPRRLAILPLTNISEDPNDEYFADGMTEELITTTSSITGLTLIARTSVMGYKGTTKKVEEIGRELRVGTVLEGSVRKAGNRLRINVQLIDVHSQGHLWAHSYDRDLHDVFAVQSDIAQRVARALKIQLVAKEKKHVERKPTKNTEAFTLYLKGRHYWNERTKEGVNIAIEYLEKAIKVDPDYARAYLGLADCYLILGDLGILPSGEAFPKARALATRALELDDSLAEAHATLGSVMRAEWDWGDSERELKRALELNPNYASAHHWYGVHLNVVGRHDEAMAEMKRAHELDPLSPIIAMNIGTTYLWERRYDEALNQFKQILETDPNFLLGHYYLGMVYAVTSMFNEAVAEIQKAKALSPAALFVNDVLAYSHGASGRREDAMRVVDELIERSRNEYVSPFRIAAAYVALDKEKAFEWLEKACEVRAGDLAYLTEHPILDPLATDPRYAALLSKMGLEK